MPRNLQTGVTGDLSTDAPGDRKTALAGTSRVPGFSGKKVNGKPGRETPPVFTAAPAIIGTPAVGSPTSYTPGTVTGSPTPTVTREWVLDGVVVSTSATYTPATTGTLVVRETAANTAGAAVSPSAAVSVTGVVLTWQFADGAAINTARNATLALVTGVPTGAIFYASPDLLPGQTLQQSGTTLNLVGDSTVPTTNSTSGATIDAVSDRDIYIEVMDGPQAVAQIMRTGELFGAGQSGSYAHIQYAMDRMQDGDTLQISPGAIWLDSTDGSTYLEGGMFHIWKSCTIQNIPGRGRWRLAPTTVPYADGYSGIVIRDPNNTYAGVDNTQFGVNPRKTIVIEGFDFSNWGRTADSGVRIRTNASDGSTFNHMHADITLRNFKLGKLGLYESASGINGGSEILTIQDAHIFDCGGGLGNSFGNDHNAYVSAKTLNIRGVRFERTRGVTAGIMDGHMLKASAVNATIEGCVFDGRTGDMTHHIQAKAGGNFTIRGTLLIDGLNNQSQGRAPINMCKEHLSDGVTPNYEWWASSQGNSMLAEKNVFVSAYGRGCVHFFSQGSADAIPTAQMTSVTIRDNIGMVATSPTVLAPFDSTKWILNNPIVGAPLWLTNNTAVTYDATEAPFSSRDLKIYNRTGGPVSAAASVSTYSFVWPHGSVARTDSYRGLA